MTEYTSSAKSLRLVADMTQRFPALQPVLDDHRRLHGQTLPYIFLWEAVQYLIQLIGRGDAASLMEARGIVDFLEDEFIKADGDREILDLIVGGFLENFPRRDENGAGLREILGPRLRERLATTYGVGD
jgi:hypothetical protein